MKIITLFGICLLLFACAPVLDRELMREGTANPSLHRIKAEPEAFKGTLFILGGLIVETKFVPNGSQMEVLSLPVDSKGYLTDTELTTGRFLAVYPRDSGLLDPVIYKKGRAVTLAGVLTGLQTGRINDMDYVYPVFEVRQVYLWEEQQDYYNVYPYPYYPYNYYANPYWVHPGWRPWGPPPPGWWW